MSNNIQPSRIWNALLNDPVFSGQTPKARNAYRRYVRALPDVLETILGQQLTLVSLCKARILYRKYALDHGMAEEITKATGGNPGVLREILENAIHQAEEARKNVPAFLRERRVITEREFLVRTLKLSGEALRRYDRKDLTIADVLYWCPWFVIRNI